MDVIYIAVSYDICDEIDLFHPMNKVPIGPIGCVDEKVELLAKRDFAPLVRVYEVKQGEELMLYKEYTFKQFECNCNKTKLH